MSGNLINSPNSQRQGRLTLSMTSKPNCTIDTNCIIALDEQRSYSASVRDLILMHKAGEINLQVVGISASERQQNGMMASTFSLFRERLARVGLGTAKILAPPGYFDITYFDHCYFVSQQGLFLEMEIHKILYPNLPFDFHIFEKTADKSNKNWVWKWRNPKCDTLTFMSHINFGGGLFVSNDDIFHGTKRAALLKVAGGDIKRPGEARNRLQSTEAMAPVPEAVSAFLRLCSDQLDLATVPPEFENMRRGISACNK